MQGKQKRGSRLWLAAWCGLMAGAAQAITPPSTDVCLDRTGVVNTPHTGLWVPVGMPKSVGDATWSIQASANGWYELQLFALEDGTPRWYATRPFQVAADGTATVNLWKRKRNLDLGPNGEETLAGQVGVRLSTRTQRIALAWDFVNGLRAAQSFCYEPLIATRTTGATFAGRFERLEGSSLAQDAFVFTDTGTQAGAPRSVAVLGEYDINREPVWLTAEAATANGLSAADLYWPQATSSSEEPWPVGALSGSAASGVGQFTYVLQTAAGLPVTMPGAAQTQVLVPPPLLPTPFLAQTDAATLTVSPSPTCTVPAGQPTCTVTVNWTRGAHAGPLRVQRHARYLKTREVDLPATASRVLKNAQPLPRASRGGSFFWVPVCSRASPMPLSA